MSNNEPLKKQCVPSCLNLAELLTLEEKFQNNENNQSSRNSLAILSRRSMKRSQDRSLVGDKKLVMALGGGFLDKKKIERILNNRR